MNYIKQFKNEMMDLFPGKSALTTRNRVNFLTGKDIDINPNDKLGKLEDVKYVINMLKNKSVGSYKTYLFHILEYLKAIGNEELYNKYNQYKDGIVKKAFAASDNNVHTDKTLDTYIPYEKLNKEFNDYFKQLIEDINKLNPKELTPAVLNEVVNFMILSLYINQPPIRNDYAYCKIVSNKKSITNKGNYFMMTPRTMYVYLNEFKNAAIIGSVRVDISKINQQYMRYYLGLVKKVYKRLPEYLFNTYKIDEIIPLSEDVIIKRLLKTSNNLFGKSLSINTFRHIYEIYLQNSPEYAKLTIGQKNDLHKQLLHSTFTAQSYNRV